MDVMKVKDDKRGAEIKVFSFKCYLENECKMMNKGWKKMLEWQHDKC